MSRDGVVGTATPYGLDGPRIESRWAAKIFAPVQTGPGSNPASYKTGIGLWPGVEGPGRGVNHPPPSSVEVKGTAIPAVPIRAFMECYRANFTYIVPSQFTLQTVFDLFCKAVRSCLNSERLTWSPQCELLDRLQHPPLQIPCCTMYRRHVTLPVPTAAKHDTEQAASSGEDSDVYSGCVGFESRRRFQLTCLRFSLFSSPHHTSARIMPQNRPRPLILQLIIHSNIPQYTVRHRPSPNKL